MPIHLREPPEPTSAASLGVSTELAESEAYRRLRRELERYVRREIIGRSFLISGHRGSGKTTMVLKAYEDVYRACRERLEPHSPVLVRLQGPDLLPESASGGTSVPSRALHQITMAMYRAVAERFAAEYRQRVMERQKLTTPNHEDLELAASFRLALDDAPVPQDLRELYRRGGFLESGVLFSPLDFVAAPKPPPPDQGMRELVALASAAQAYRMILYEISSDRTDITKATDEQSRSVAIQPTAKEALQLVTGLLLGGAVGAGVLSGDQKAVAAGLAAAGTAIAATLVLKLSSARSRKRMVKEEDKLARVYDASTLERELPILVERLHQAGLAPVFMVDELDKVRSLRELMLPVVDRLKGFVSERAFFCFLTDRDYFEHLRSRLQAEPYPREHTYFADRLFVLYRPEDLHRYLTGSGEDSASPDAPRQGGILETVGGEPADKTTRAILPYLLLHRAKMHPADLRRELQRMRDAQGYVTLSRSAPRSGSASENPSETPGALTTDFGYRFAITVQLTVEHLLDRDELCRRIDHDPHFAQSACDALYYISRRWEEGNEQLDLSETTFVEYLTQRMDPNRDSAEPGANTEGENDSPTEDHGPIEVNKRNEGQNKVGVRPFLSRADLSYLHSLVKEQAELILDPQRLLQVVATAKTRRLPPKTALDAVPTEVCLLEAVRRTKDKYVFCFDPYGRALRPSSPGMEKVSKRKAVRDSRSVQQTAIEIKSKTDFIRGLDAFIADFTGTMTLYRLADELFILSTSPAWPQVSDALGRLDAAADGKTHSPFSEDLQVIDDYARALHRRARILVLSLLYGSVLGRSDPASDLKLRRVNGLRLLAQSLGFSNVSSEERLVEILLSYATTVDKDIRKSLERAARDLELEVGQLEEWKSSVQAAVVKHEQQLSPELVAELQDSAWDRWRARLHQFLVQRVTEFAPEEQDLLCRLAGRTPATLFRFDLSRVSLADWSRALHLSLDRNSQGDSQFCPFWVAPVALVSLNLGHLVVDRHGDRIIDRRPHFHRLATEAGKEADLEHFAEALSWVEQRLAPLQSGPPRPVVLILPRATGSLTEGWLPGRRHGAVAVPREMPPESSAVTRLLTTAASELNVPVVLLVEIDPRLEIERLGELAVRNGFPLSQVVLLAESREILVRIGETRLRATGFSHSVVKPRDVDDAVEQALRIISPA